MLFSSNRFPLKHSGQSGVFPPLSDGSCTDDKLTSRESKMIAHSRGGHDLTFMLTRIILYTQFHPFLWKIQNFMHPNLFCLYIGTISRWLVQQWCTHVSITQPLSWGQGKKSKQENHGKSYPVRAKRPCSFIRTTEAGEAEWSWSQGCNDLKMTPFTTFPGWFSWGHDNRF